MKIEIIPIVKDNLWKVAEAGAKFGMPRSEGWLLRCLYDPTVEDLVSDKIRGHMAVDVDSGLVVAVYAYYYQPCFFKQKKFLADTGCIMGANAKYGENLLCVIDSNYATRKTTALGFGNEIASKRAAKVNKVVNKLSEPPCRARECRVGVADLTVYPVTLLNRLHVPMGMVNLAWLVSRPLSWICRLFEDGSKDFAVSEGQSFGLGFEDFWQRFLASNTGVVSSREPARLRWLFQDSMHAGKVKLIVAKRDGRIEGYALLREMVGKGCAKVFELIDICAVGNEILCLRTLARAALKVARKYRGMKVLFYGCMPNQEQWLDFVFKIRRETDHPFFMYGSRNPEILKSLSENKGWFFGPYDGERCMGHGGYIDL